MFRIVLMFSLSLPVSAMAHPHVFVETRLGLIYNDAGQLEAVRVGWVYDEFYSLLIMEEMRLDPDYDGVLTDDELTQLKGFDLNWIEGFEGDLYIDGVEFAGPVADDIALEDGRIVSTHVRPLAKPLSADQSVTIKAFDPTYYTAYEVAGDIPVEGRQDCAPRLQKADIAAATDLLEELLFAAPQSELEENFPAVGEAFADSVTVKCSA
ncbi:DUF1007 family protein [Pseudaestuariivita rosea]|uniref:DUF1007 family protein n=1 Tax=Pseudaestuariivita rosea TaxID=2763263 RepID=UPI001ABB7700|nr:DUF1007 family protein [Pseudaestuariivita rosea]